MIGYEVTGIDQTEDRITYFALFLDCDSTAFESTVKESKWWKAMYDEIATIERNNTWDISNLPKGHKTIGVKQIFKTKLKESSKVDNYRVQLVAKGYKQDYGFDYKEVFALVARRDTIKLVITLACNTIFMIHIPIGCQIGVLA